MVEKKFIDERKYINPNILAEGNQMKILEKNKDEMKAIVRCNNCGKPTEYGKTRMCSGFVGCDNKINVDGKEVNCYFDDLLPRIMKYKNSNKPEEYNLYKTGKVYRWRDNVEQNEKEQISLMKHLYSMDKQRKKYQAKIDDLKYELEKVEKGKLKKEINKLQEDLKNEKAEKEVFKIEAKAYKEENKILKLERKEYKNALIDMVNQFADTDKDEKYLSTMGLSALENAFDTLNIDEGIEREKLWKLIEENK